MIGRREFISLLGGGVAWPLAAHAQQPAMPVVGFLRVTSASDSTHLVAAFQQGLKQTGFVDGQNVAIEFRWAENRLERLPELGADLVRRKNGGPFALGRRCAGALQGISDRRMISKNE